MTDCFAQTLRNKNEFLLCYYFQLTIADLAVYDTSCTLLKLDANCLDNAASIQLLRQTIEAEKNPSLQKYLQNRADTDA